jgi:hypothetical protein
MKPRPFFVPSKFRAFVVGSGSSISAGFVSPGLEMRAERRSRVEAEGWERRRRRSRKERAHFGFSVALEPQFQATTCVYPCLSVSRLDSSLRFSVARVTLSVSKGNGLIKKLSQTST